MTVITERPPKDNLFRALEMRVDEIAPGANDTTDTQDVLEGHFAVFNTWTRISSAWEGDFMESIAPGAFTKTFNEQRGQMRVLLQHGYDPELGDRPIATIAELREDAKGAYYKAPLLDGLPDLVVSGLKAGQYGASFRFKILREEWVEDPGVSDYNPMGLPERTIRECSVREFGPCTWGAYDSATAGMMASEGMRSLTDEWIMDRLTADPEKLRAVIEKRTKRMADEARALGEIAGDVPATDAPDEQRDSETEGIGAIGQMIALAAEYIDTEPDQADVETMQEVIDILSALLTSEGDEEDATEPPEPPARSADDNTSDAPAESSAEDDARRNEETDAPPDEGTRSARPTKTPPLRGPSWYITNS